MDKPAYITLAILVVFCILSFTYSGVIVERKYKETSRRIYQNLHAKEYPITTSDSVPLTVQTPGLPIHLAGKWEIQNALNIPNEALQSSYSLVYPLIEGTNDIIRLLSQHANITGSKYCAACHAQRVFNIKNALKESQKYQYCPKRGEKQADWLIRTGQTKNEDERNTYFYFNNEHPEFCRKTRVPSMVLSHISTNSFSLFSSQDYEMLLLLFGTVNILFSFSMAIYKGWAIRLPSVREENRLHVGGQFSFLFLLLLILSLIPILVDFLRTGNGKLSYKKSLGSCLVGIWTIMFSIVYIYVIPRMNVKLTKPDTENGYEKRKKDPLIVKYFVSNQPMISLAYWNFMQAPCIMLVILTKYSYGIDVYMQFILFGTIAVSVLDIIHTRVNMIAGLTRRVLDQGHAKIHPLPTNMDIVVWFTFAAMNLVISVPIILKLQQSNVSFNSLVVACIVLYSNLFQKLVILVLRLTRRFMTKNIDEEEQTPLKNDADSTDSTEQDSSESANESNPVSKMHKHLYNSTFDATFELSLIWHMLMTLIVAFILIF